MKTKINLFLIAAIITLQLNAQSISEKVDSAVARAMNERHIAGVSLAVIVDGVPVKIKGYGFADIEHGVAVNPETIFQSGSIGKQFTATAIMQLMEERKLKLDDKITTYFAGSPASWKAITIRHLLTHTSGIPDIPEDSTGINLQTNYTETELFQKAKSLKLLFQPGYKWSYSNTGYILLGIIIRAVTGKFYGDVIQEKIFAPLSMETARIINEEDIVMNRAAGYQLKDGVWKNQTWVAPSLNTTADGSIYLTILDLVKWDAAITQKKLISDASRNLMTTPVRIKNDSTYNYGFAWFLNPINKHKAQSHSGSWQGFNSFLLRFPDDGLTIIILTNTFPSKPGLIAEDIAAIYFNNQLQFKK
jgi:CubicO group peptidase (beta-lactamase class C family)